MIVYKEVKEIAKCNQKIADLIKELEAQTDLDGLHMQEAKVVNHDNTYFDDLRAELVDDEYYCVQSHGYYEDEFYGTLWFATDVKDEYVEIPFSTY